MVAGWLGIAREQFRLKPYRRSRRMKCRWTISSGAIGVFLPIFSDATQTKLQELIVILAVVALSFYALSMLVFRL